MAFHASPRTLERLEWPAVAARIAARARTPRGRERAEAPAALFQADAAGMRARLAEGEEARALLEAGEAPPLSAVRRVEEALERAARGGLLEPAELLDVAATCGAVRETRALLEARAAAAPRLAERAEALAPAPALERAVEAAIGPEGHVRDEASPELAAARRDVRRLGEEARRSVEALARSAELRPALTDDFVTLRGGRYVLPVRAEARGRVPGLVHDVSASGSTVFVEPQAAVETSNRLRQAERAAEREERRVLRELSERTAAQRGELEASLEALEALDLAFARAAFARELRATAPEVGESGVYRLPALRHPLLPPDEAVPSDVALGEEARVLVVSGPNAGGKTVALKALALAALLARAGCAVPAGPGARVDAAERVLAVIGDEQDLRESLSSFSAHMASVAGVVEEADARSLVALDEIGTGTDPSEGAALAQAVLEALASAGARVVATTHYNLLKELAAVDPRFENASVELDPETLAPTFRLVTGAPGASSAAAVAARMGLRGDVLERAEALQQREDRALERMLSELSASRLALERERREAERLREEGEAARSHYRAKLERLQERRDALFEEMRVDLERAFRGAHEEVARVIRELQREGSAQGAERARRRLHALREEAQERTAREHEARREAGRGTAPGPRERVDWRRARPGDPVRVPGGREGRVLALPDGRGRVAVQVGAAKLRVPADELAPAASEGSGVARAPARGAPPRVAVQRAGTADAELAPARGGPRRCDLRGLRVHEALERLDAALDAAAAEGAERLEIVHGLGTGALRRAVREHLRGAPLVERLEAEEPSAGGEGVTLAHLAR